MPQAVSMSPRFHANQPLDSPSPGNSIAGQRVNYNNFPDIAGDYTVGTLGASEQFAGVDPSNINFKFPLRAYNNGFFQSNTTLQSAIKEDIKTLILTSKGERVIQPDLGTNIPTLAGQLFESINVEEMQMLIESEIRSAIQRWMPFITVNSIVVRDSEMDNSLQLNQIRVSMSYTIVSNNANDTIGFTISDG